MNTTPSSLSEPLAFKPPSVLLMGAPGAGKTWSIITLLQAGLEVFCIFTDAGGYESLVDACEQNSVDMSKLHWHYVPIATASWGELIDMGKKINAMGYEDLSKIKSGVSKAGFGKQFFELLDCLSNFKDDRTGETFGPVDQWGPERCLVVDSFSGVNKIIWNMTVGAKPAAHQGEWGVAMNAEEHLLDKLTGALNCFFVLTAHVEREVDEAAGTTKLMVGALGRKLAPKIPRNFSEVIFAYHEGDSFHWSTATINVDTKNRALPISSKLDPDFRPIVEAWKRRQSGTSATASQPAASEAAPGAPAPSAPAAASA